MVTDAGSSKQDPLSLEDVGERSRFLWALLLTMILDAVFIVAWLCIAAACHWIFDVASAAAPSAAEALGFFEQILFWVTLLIVSWYIAIDAWKICKRIWRQR